MHALLIALALAGSAQEATAPATFQDLRGIVISTPRAGQDWASDAMQRTIGELPTIGANSVSIHPYAWVSRESGEVRTFLKGTDHVTLPIRWAKHQGITILVKPHLAYWGQFSWRGEIGWNDETKWNRFRESYRSWILDQAKLAGEAGADAFAIGTELRQSEHMTDWWRGLIREIREVFPGHLTYAANWDDYDRIEFWKDLDSIGIQAYFPLTDSADPSSKDLQEAWVGPLQEMRTISKKHGRPILWTEIGYNNAETAAARPWESSRHTQESALQLRLLQAALDVAETDPAIIGLYLWKWFPGGSTSQPFDFVVQTPQHKELLQSAWGSSRSGENNPAK